MRLISPPISTGLVTLLRSMLCVDPRDRATIDFLKLDPWVAGFALYRQALPGQKVVPGTERRSTVG
jgi:hypothetical protein